MLLGESRRQPPRIRCRNAEDYYEETGVGKGDNKTTGKRIDSM
jgi:hypothetical protein